MNYFLNYLSLVLFFIPSFSFAQTDTSYFDSNLLRYDNFIYKKSIHTVQLQREDFEFAPPVIHLGANERLKLLFDDFSTESKNYRFTIIHCDANWSPTDRLLQSEYISGFFDDGIIDYSYSKLTLQKYVHYELLFPTENLKPTKSGNYLLKVFSDYDQNNLVLTRRFMVLDDRVSVLFDIHRPGIVDDYNSKQEIDFTVQQGDYQITNPYQDLKIILMQNDRWDNAITKLKPQFVKDNELTYHSETESIFPGGNEFRNFDIKEIRASYSEFVQKIKFDSLRNYHVYLFPDKRRNTLRYFQNPDINGKFKIVRQESSPNASVTEAEYVYVHFTLPMENPVMDGGVYIFGALTDWKYSNENKMKYNPALQQYEATLFLKQGYYNYEYMLLKDKENFGDETFIEGSHFETENDYTIYVYHHPLSSNYDQLIGMKRFNSVRY
jgi:hypothetical protein